MLAYAFVKRNPEARMAFTSRPLHSVQGAPADPSVRVSGARLRQQRLLRGGQAEWEVVRGHGRLCRGKAGET